LIKFLGCLRKAIPRNFPGGASTFGTRQSLVTDG
jgi:hypothetical protein